jgi:hypothetical protein
MENQESQTTQPENIQAAPPELTITDLNNIRTILDAASRRGAFGAAEMAGVGGVYNKLDAFLNAVAPSPAGDAQQPSA